MLARNYAYSYDNLARKELPNRFVPPKVVKKERNYKHLRHQIIMLGVVSVLCYFGNVVLSEFYVVKTNSLVNLKQREETLLEQNQALKIEVDRLKSPARITGIASSKLGMSTARSNIYVHADSKKIAHDGYAYARK